VNGNILATILLAGCRECGAKRGAPCVSDKGRVWTGSVHYIRRDQAKPERRKERARRRAKQQRRITLLEELWAALKNDDASAVEQIMGDLRMEEEANG
jgi:hypothetical protein